MEHDDLIAALGPYRDGELPPAERARVEAHLAACAGCRRLAAGYGRLADALLRRPAPTSEAFVRRVMAALPPEEAEASPAWGWWAPALGFAAAALALALVVPRARAPVSAEAVLLAGLPGEAASAGAFSPQASSSDDLLGSVLEGR